MSRSDALFGMRASGKSHKLCLMVYKYSRAVVGFSERVGQTLYLAQSFFNPQGDLF
jgi:hypothetical protein